MLPASEEVDSRVIELVVTGVSKVSQKESAPSLLVPDAVAIVHAPRMLDASSRSV